MNTWRTSIILVGGLGTLALLSASLFAKPKQEQAISDCNIQLTKCLDEGQQLYSGKTRSRWEDVCLNRWNKCMDKAGAPKDNRRAEGVPESKRGVGDRGVGGRPYTGGAAASATPSPKVRDSDVGAKTKSRQKKSDTDEKQ